MCATNMTIKTDEDLYFVITNTILNIEKPTFTINDVVKELKQAGVTEESIEIAKGRLKKSVEICVQNLIEHGKVIEEPRTYQLAEKM